MKHSCISKWCEWALALRRSQKPKTYHSGTSQAVTAMQWWPFLAETRQQQTWIKPSSASNWMLTCSLCTISGGFTVFVSTILRVMCVCVYNIFFIMHWLRNHTFGWHRLQFLCAKIQLTSRPHAGIHQRLHFNPGGRGQASVKHLNQDYGKWLWFLYCHPQSSCVPQS